MFNALNAKTSLDRTNKPGPQSGSLFGIRKLIARHALADEFTTSKVSGAISSRRPLTNETSSKALLKFAVLSKTKTSRNRGDGEANWVGVTDGVCT
jgi:hypothetical protein